MLKTNNFFVISNYNTNPVDLIDYCKDYIVYDQSDKSIFNIEDTDLKFEKTKHTGHNISDYFKYFIDNYDHLPDFIALIKGNIIGRHLSKEYFDRVYNNKYYTFLYEDNKNPITFREKVFSKTSESEFLEINNSWYVERHPHKYFIDFNHLLKFIYKYPTIPKFCLFSPGACYIVSKYQVLKNSKEFYINLSKLFSYTLEPRFPSEAHQIERMLHLIYTSNYEVNEYMNDSLLFDLKLEKYIKDNPPIIKDRLINKVIKKVINKFRIN